MLPDGEWFRLRSVRGGVGPFRRRSRPARRAARPELGPVLRRASSSRWATPPMQRSQIPLRPPPRSTLFGCRGTRPRDSSHSAWTGACKSSIQRLPCRSPRRDARLLERAKTRVGVPRRQPASHQRAPGPQPGRRVKGCIQGGSVVSDQRPAWRVARPGHAGGRAALGYMDTDMACDVTGPKVSPRRSLRPRSMRNPLLQRTFPHSTERTWYGLPGLFHRSSCRE
jgi:hypothetical protein